MNIKHIIFTGLNFGNVVVVTFRGFFIVVVSGSLESEHRYLALLFRLLLFKTRIGNAVRLLVKEV